MPFKRDSLYFNYDGKSCRDFGLMLVNLDNAMLEEQLTAPRNLIETRSRGNDDSFLHYVEEEPIEFDMVLAFVDQITDENMDAIIRWLFQDTYKPLYFENSPNKLFYCMAVGEPIITHNGLRQGYITVHMKCNSSKIKSPLQYTPLYDLTNNAGNYKITINNQGHVPIFPEISIDKVGGIGTITITKDGKIFEIRDLANGEKIYVNTEKEIIISDIPGVYRYDKIVGDFYNMRMNVGVNEYFIDGKCKIQFRFRFKYRF